MLDAIICSIQFLQAQPDVQDGPHSPLAVLCRSTSLSMKAKNAQTKRISCRHAHLGGSPHAWTMPVGIVLGCVGLYDVCHPTLLGLSQVQPISVICNLQGCSVRSLNVAG